MGKKIAIFEVEFDPDSTFDAEGLAEFNGDWLKAMQWLYGEEGMGIFGERPELVDIKDEDNPNANKEERVMADKQPVSNCHQAPLAVVMGDEGTNYYQCSKCGQACDPMGDKEKLEEQIVGILQEHTQAGYYPIVDGRELLEAILSLINEARHDELARVEVHDNPSKTKAYIRKRHKVIDAPRKN